MSALSLKLVCAKFSGCIAYFKIYVKEVLLLHALDQITVYIIIPMYTNVISVCLISQAGCTCALTGSIIAWKKVYQ